MQAEIGDRVGAILSADKDEALFLGYGEYLGKQRLPADQKDMFGMNEEEASAYVRNEFLGKEKPLIWDVDIVMSEKFDEIEGISDEERQAVREEVQRYQDGHREYIGEEDIVKMIERTRVNPCIKLDNGDTVWGYQCWWGPEKEIEERLSFSETVREVRISEVFKEKDNENLTNS